MGESKAAEYTLKIAAKRQITVPKGILDALNLKQGDEFQIVIRSPTDIRLVPYTRIRQDLITPEIAEILKQRRAEIDDGAGMISQQALLKKAAAKIQRGDLRYSHGLNHFPGLKNFKRRCDQSARRCFLAEEHAGIYCDLRSFLAQR